MAGLQDYLTQQNLAQEYDEELNPVPLDVSSYEAVAAQGAPNSPALQKYLQLAGQAASQEQGGLSQLQNYLTEYQQKPRETDFRPLATLVDQLSPRGGNATQRLAEQMAPESEDARQEKIVRLQDMIQSRRQGMTKTQMGLLQAQLTQEQKAAQQAQAMQLAKDKFEQQRQLAADKLEQERLRTEAYREQGLMRKEIAQMQMNAAKAAKNDSQARADERQRAGLDQKNDKIIADQVVKLGKDLGGELPALAGSVKTIEGLLGHNLEAYDPKTKTFNGMKVDAPGKNVPLMGRMYIPGSAGEEFEVAFKGIFNSLLKQRSGAAVTNQELARLRTEFASGAFNTEEEMIGALHRFKKALRKSMQQSEKSYRPEAIERFRDQGGELTEDLLGMEAPPPTPERKEYQGKVYEKQGDTWVEVTQ